MSSSETDDGAVLHRLRGEFDGVERFFELVGVEHRVGSSSASDVRLAVDGVSRQHAVLYLTPGGLVVEDRGSKNGTFVNQSRVERASVPAGATIAFGSAELVHDVVEVDDIELAVVLDPTPEEAAKRSSLSYLSQETASFAQHPDASVAEVWLSLVDGFAERLFATPRGEAASALSYLVETLGAQASCLVEWIDDGDPVVLATYGSIGELLPYRQVVSRDVPSFHVDESVALAVARDREKAPLQLCVWGDFAGRTTSLPLLRILLRLLDRSREWDVHHTAETGAAPRTVASHPDLVFPEDYQVAVSRAMTALYEQIRVLAHRDLPVLLSGETGVGKERLADVVHRSSGRRDGPFVALNCAAIPSGLLEAELFGIGKGVATGVEARPGKFELADGGTLFLDEIGEMQPALQAKLLRVLQERQVQVVGAAPRKVDLRIVAATNADLDRRMAEGTFRPDLYYRLAGVDLRVPPLRECPQDVPLLIDHFFSHFVRESGLRVRGITVKAFRALVAYPWPGNVRELRHEIRRLVFLCADGDVVDARKLSPRILTGQSHDTAPIGDDDTLELEVRIRDLERRLISQALQRSEGRQVRAAELLGISRNGLAEKLRRLGIQARDFRPQRPPRGGGKKE